MELWLRRTRDILMRTSLSEGSWLRSDVYNVTSMLGPFMHLRTPSHTYVLLHTLACLPGFLLVCCLTHINGALPFIPSWSIQPIIALRYQQ
jgi:hypothetical protein